MEIYKLKDFEKVGGDDFDAVGELRITDIRQAVRNENRVNIFVNDKYAFSLDIAQVIEMHIKKGMAITAEQLDEYKKASEFGKLYQRALEWVLSRPHSKKELHDYLYKKVYEKKLDKSYIDKIIEKMISKKYIDDYKFAEWYAESLSERKNFSIKRLEMELLKKGIKREIVNEILEGSETHDAEEVEKIIAKKYHKYDDKNKLIQYLCRQGFPYDLVRDSIQSFEMDLRN